MTTPLRPAVVSNFRDRTRVAPLEVAFWLLAAATVPLLPDYHLILTEIAILALFTISLDLILGYAGIISLGHAAFFGFGGYAAGLLAKHGVITEPVLGLAAAGVASAMLGFMTSFLVLRGSDLTRLMVTLGVALVLREIANKFASITGGADGLQGITMAPILGLYRFDLYGHNGYVYSLVVLFMLFVVARQVVRAPFGVSLQAIRGNALRAEAIGIPVTRRLVAVYTLAAAYAGVAGALLAQTQSFVSLDYLSFERSADVFLVLVIGGAGYLYGGIVGAAAFKFLQDWISGITPQYWQFWLGAVLVAIVVIGRDRMAHWASPIRRFVARYGRWPGASAKREKV